MNSVLISQSGRDLRSPWNYLLTGTRPASSIVVYIRGKAPRPTGWGVLRS